jgi:tyrosyl-tRNA synthetase
VNELIKKDAIARRLEGENGISYTEFAYPLLQGFDYLTLYREKGCTLQTGGSDQWGNLVAGTDLIRRIEGVQAHVLTTPLIIDKATGKKFGKSEGNAVWLDAEKTSPYAFYQFWLNASDESVIDYLKLFTFLSLEEIETLEQEAKNNPGSRTAQKRLAFEVTTFVHGKTVADGVEQVSTVLFGEGDIATLSEEGKEILLKNAPTYILSEQTSITDVLVLTQLATSKREARTFIESGAVTLGGVKVSNGEDVVMVQRGSLLPLRRGKKQFVILHNN